MLPYIQSVLAGKRLIPVSLETMAYGKLRRTQLQKKGVDVSHLKVMPGSTAVTHVEIIDGERILGDYEEGVMAEFKLSEEDIEFLGSQDLVVSGIWE